MEQEGRREARRILLRRQHPWAGGRAGRGSAAARPEPPLFPAPWAEGRTETQTETQTQAHAHSLQPVA